MPKKKGMMMKSLKTNIMKRGQQPLAMMPENMVQFLI